MKDSNKLDSKQQTLIIKKLDLCNRGKINQMRKVPLRYLKRRKYQEVNKERLIKINKFKIN